MSHWKRQSKEKSTVVEKLNQVRFYRWVNRFFYYYGATSGQKNKTQVEGGRKALKDVS